MGSFDGVHLGHRKILDYVRKIAQETGGQSLVITFSPHPQQVLHPQEEFFTINTLEENARLIEQSGIDALLILPFTPAFSQLSFGQFLQLLSEKAGVKVIVMGPNHSFGHNREGNCKSMQQICEQNGIRTVTIPEFVLEDSRVRSSKIREHIKNKEFTKAETLLGHSYKKIK